MPLVSVVLPNYNYARYLRERVCSILQQTMPDFELLYLDDASQDESNLIIQEFSSDPRVQLHLFSQNSGRVYQRWNDGAALAKGDWLWFAGADDSAEPEFLSTLLGVAKAHPSAAIVHCSGFTVDHAGRILSDGYYFIPELSRYLSQDYFSPGFEEAGRLSAACFLYTASNMLIRRDAFEQAGGFDTRFWRTADYDLYLSILRYHDIAYSAQRLGVWRMHTQTVSNKTRSAEGALEEAYCLARAYQWMRDDPRCSEEDRLTMLTRARALVFDAFIEPGFVVPEKLRFAADLVHQVVPDKRLLTRATESAGNA